ncbi:DUF1858 domain-containing protein [Bosea massiliensis]|uniref:DUF1858 domain-containing protein n=1 Tax=Bosea massiliensis TaxID=151419 RepID=A0ABW0NY39_9HYPH
MPSIQPETLVDDVMRQWPETIRVFLRHRFLCVGCPIGRFHSVRDACRDHRHNLASFVQALEAAAGRACGEREMR